MVPLACGEFQVSPGDPRRTAPPNHPATQLVIKPLAESQGRRFCLSLLRNTAGHLSDHFLRDDGLGRQEDAAMRVADDVAGAFIERAQGIIR